MRSALHASRTVRRLCVADAWPSSRCLSTATQLTTYGLLARSATASGSNRTSSAGVASVAEKGPVYEHTARGFATGTREVENVADPLHSATNDIKDLLPVDATKFYEMAGTTERQYVPEGCPALLEEFETTRTRNLMLRSSFFRLLDIISPDRKGATGVPPVAKGTQLHLEGPTGAGKSVLLAQLTHWARASGWLVLYIPSARHYLSNSAFSKHASGLLDTPDTASDLLKSLHAAHATLLAGITLKDGTNLGELVESGARQSTDTGGSVDVTGAALQVLEALQNEDLGVPVLLAMDDYNCLFGGTEFMEVPSLRHSRLYGAQELRLTLALRDMSVAPKHGARVVATSQSIGASKKVGLQGVPLEARRRVPLLDYNEIAQYITHLRATGRTDCPSEPSEVSRYQFLSGGSISALRTFVLAFGSSDVAAAKASSPQ